MDRLHSLALAAVCAALSFPAQAQQSSAPAIGDFTIERVLALSGVSAPTAPNIPPDVLNAIQAGALDIHQVLVYSSAQRTIDQGSYIVPGGSPAPYPNLSSAALVDHYVIQVDSATAGQAHGPSVAMVGHVVSNDMPTPFGDITGAEVTLTFGYQGSGASTRFGSIMIEGR
jgi:hypothetical protein